MVQPKPHGFLPLPSEKVVFSPICLLSSPFVNIAKLRYAKQERLQKSSDLGYRFKAAKVYTHPCRPRDELILSKSSGLELVLESSTPRSTVP